MKKLIWALLICIGLASLPKAADAGDIELSTGFSFNKTNYPDTGYSWTRRYGVNLGYNFTQTSELEFAFQDVTERNKINGYEDTTFHDRIYSVNWNQGLLPRTFPIQPYVKLGVGQLNREASGTYANGAVPPSKVDSITAILGGGLRIYITRSFAIRAEATSYLTGGRIRTWKDNIGVTFGGSFYF